MLYTVVGLAWLVGWICLKAVAIFMDKADKAEMSTLYKEFKPDRKDF